MQARTPVKVELLPHEQELIEKIEFNPQQLSLGGRFQQVLEESCAAAGPLTRTLLKRRAIPEVRVRYFTDPEHGVRGLFRF